MAPPSEDRSAHRIPALGMIRCKPGVWALLCSGMNTVEVVLVRRLPDLARQHVTLVNSRRSVDAFGTADLSVR